MSGREAAERKAREDEIKIETEVERRMKEELARRDREAARQAREEAERKAREEAQRQARERKAREEAQKQAREEAEKKAREDKIKFEIEVERRVREELEKRDIEAARLATEESQRIAREQQLKQREKEEQENRDREEREREEQKEMQLRQKEPRRVLKQYMNNHEFAKLQQWLEQSRNQLEALFEAGDVPVVGWLQLAETIKCSEVNRARLEVEWDENARNCEQIQQQIRTLREELAKLANRDSQILEETKKMTEILSLTSEMGAICMLGKKEQMAVAKVELKMKNEYFLGDLEFDDVSTAFSMFEMDGMFSRFKKNETNSNLEVVVNASVTYLQHYMELEFPEAVEMLFKFKLFENGEKGVERHLASCSICSSTKLDVLLKEYEMTEDEMKQIQEKIKEWKGYYVVIMNAMGGSLEIPAGSLRSKLATCLMRIQKVHKWKRDYGVTPVSQ